ncbi:response regulator [Modestobacter lapidis]|nr:response regulator [Modestobacter lapidis]
MAELDWAATPLGPVPTWPMGLRFAVRTVLASRFPMVLTWGPEYRQFYNDAYAPCIGAKHPAIGEDIRVTLAEGWAVLAGPVDAAIHDRQTSWLPRLPLLLERAGYREETYFTVSHAPAYGDDGQVAGMHAVLTESTGEVLGDRRQQLLHDLSVAGGRLGNERAVVAALGAALATDPLDVPFAAVYLLDGADRRLHRVHTVGCPADLLPAACATADELPRDVTSLQLRGGVWDDVVRDAVVLPVTAGDEPIGVLLAAVSPNRALDDGYRTFHELLAAQLAGALANARAFEAERRRAESLAELDRAKTAFFSDVSHELRTPLTLLLGPISDVLDDPAEPLALAVREQLTLAMRNGQRLQRLVNDLMDFAGIEAGRASAVRVETDVAAFTADLAGVLRAAAERAGLQLTVDCPPLGRPAYVDPRLWEKIVLNLLSNAVKYTFVGSIAVSLRAAGDDIALTVADTGIGIPTDELPRVFERFHRVPGSAARNREGTGIGLALVRELVALHGGAVSVTSVAGRGSTFTVTVPFGRPDAPAAEPVTPSAAALGTADAWETDVAVQQDPVAVPGAPTVLVVDDNADMRGYVTRLLALTCTVRAVANGAEALEAVAVEVPDVVVTDVMMPRVDGFELLRRLRADPATRAVQVIMLTARAGQEAAVEGFDAGVDDYLAKPFRAAELVARVRVAVERAARNRATGGAPGTAPSAGRAASATVPVVPSPDVRSLVPTSRPAEAAGPVAVPPPAAAEETALRERWRFTSAPQTIAALRRALRRLLDSAGLDEDQAYDLLLAACEAATNAIEHAQDPTEPFFDVSAEIDPGSVTITVRDYGQWRERVPSMDRGRGSTLMSAFADITATPSPQGTTVVIRAPRSGGG